MALTTGANVGMVRVNTQAQYNDIASKQPGTLYWVVETKKIILDGTEYGFNSGDVTAALLNSLINTINQTGNNVEITKQVVGNQLRLNAKAILSGNPDNILQEAADGLWVSLAAIENEVDLRINNQVITKIGVANGIASLDNGGKVPAAQLPSYVDDVLTYNSVLAFPATGEAGKIYIASDTNKTYRWSGSNYVEISASLALGETASTAYRGDRGKTAYDHSQILSGNPHGTTKAMVGLGLVQDYGIAFTAEAEAGAVDNKYMTPLKTAQAIAALAPKMTWTVIT